MFVQTDYKKTYDNISRDAIRKVMREFNIPDYLINAAEIAMKDYKMILKIKGGKMRCIISRCGVKQGCPLSPLIYIIVFDILIHKLESCEIIKLIRAYMDDIGVLFKKNDDFNIIKNIFELYNKAVDACLNYNKCSYLIREGVDCSDTIGWWVEAVRIYITKYLGILLGGDVGEKNWESALKKMKKKSLMIRRIKNITIENRISLINIYIVSHIPYVGRFVLMSSATCNKIINIMKGCFKCRTPITFHQLSNRCKPFCFSCQLKHPYLFNISLLAVKKPRVVNYNTMLLDKRCSEFLRRWAVDKYYWYMGTPKLEEQYDNYFKNLNDYIQWRERTKSPAKILYNIFMASMPAICVRETVLGAINDERMECVLYNLSYPVNKNYKNIYLYHIFKGWTFCARLSHFMNVSDRCSFGCGEREIYSHMIICERVWNAIGRCKEYYEGVKLHSKNLIDTRWPDGIDDLLMTREKLCKNDVELRLTLFKMIKKLRYWCCVNVDNYLEYAYIIIKNILKIKPMRRDGNNHQHNVIIDGDVVNEEMMEMNEAQQQPGPILDGYSYGYCDGSGYTDFIKSSCGACVGRNNVELDAMGEMFFASTSNEGEYRGMVFVKLLAIRNNITKIYIRSDSKLMVGIEQGETFMSEDHLLCIYHVSRALDDYLEEKRYEFVYR